MIATASAQEVKDYKINKELGKTYGSLIKPDTEKIEKIAKIEGFEKNAKVRNG